MNPIYEPLREDFKLSKEYFESQILSISTHSQEPQGMRVYDQINQYDRWIQLWQNIQNELIWARRDRESMLKQIESQQKLLESQRDTIKLLESHLDIQDVPDNYDMSVEDIKKLLAKECKSGQQYYPSDIALDHGLDYDKVLEAVASLKEEGLIQS